MTTTVETAPSSPIFTPSGNREINAKLAQPAGVLALLAGAAQVWVLLEYLLGTPGPADWTTAAWIVVFIRAALAVLLLVGAARILGGRAGGGWPLVIGALGATGAFFLEPLAVPTTFGDRFVTIFDSSLSVGILFASVLGLAALIVGTMYAGKKATWTVVDVAVVVYALIPVVWMISLSLKSTETMTDKSYLPMEISLEHYETILDGEFSLFLQPLINSIGISVIATVIAVVLGTMAAYAIARLDFPGKRALVGISLLIAMFPQISLVSPLFEMERALGLFDSWPGLILPFVTFALPLAIYTLSAFFREIPWELEKAAKMDGATPAQAFRRVIAPLAAPGVFTTAILVFIFCWNDFLFAISLTSTEDARTVPAALAFFTGASQFESPTGPLAAAAVIITIPIILFVLFFQRRIVAGLTSGAVKG